MMIEMSVNESDVSGILVVSIGDKVDVDEFPFTKNVKMSQCNFFLSLLNEDKII